MFLSLFLGGHVEGGAGAGVGVQKQQLTSASPAMMLMVLPLGTTCAMSDSRTVSLLPFTSVTRSDSSFSGLKRPPARSWERSCVSFSIALRMFASRVEKSKASSVDVGAAAPSTGGEESVEACERLTLPVFLKQDGLVVKVRCGNDGYVRVDVGMWYNAGIGVLAPVQKAMLKVEYSVPCGTFFGRPACQLVGEGAAVQLSSFVIGL